MKACNHGHHTFPEVMPACLHYANTHIATVDSNDTLKVNVALIFLTNASILSYRLSTSWEFSFLAYSS